MSSNPSNVLAGSGTCFGDSGGPSSFLNGYQRVDIPILQDWLARYGVRP
jgi:hypothetical protein